MTHYVVVLIPLRWGGWRAHFPDFAGCRAEDLDLERARKQAKRLAVVRLAEMTKGRAAMPPARSYEQIRADTLWAEKRGIDIRRAIVTFENLGGLGPDTRNRPSRPRVAAVSRVSLRDFINAPADANVRQRGQPVPDMAVGRQGLESGKLVAIDRLKRERLAREAQLSAGDQRRRQPG